MGWQSEYKSWFLFLREKKINPETRAFHLFPFYYSYLADCYSVCIYTLNFLYARSRVGCTLLRMN